jgi:hypothetical protein
MRGNATTWLAALGRFSMDAGPNRLYAAGLQKPANIASELAVAVEYDVAVGTRERKSLTQLLNDPIAGGVSRHVEMQNPPPLMLDHKKAVQHAEGQCLDREEVESGNYLAMVL